MSVEQMRARIKRVYSPLGLKNSWTIKVDKMKDKQVFAVYRSFVQRRLI